MAGLDIINEYESEVRSYVRSFPVVFTKGHGSIMTDEAGTEYVDFFTGAGTLNYGHNNPAIRGAIIDYLNAEGIVHGLDMATAAKVKFIETFEEIILRPRGLDYKLQFTGPTGANSVEAALKLARRVTGRSNVIAFTHSFHGLSLGSLAVTSNSHYREAAGQPLGNVTFHPYDGYLPGGVDSIAYLDTLLDDSGSGLDAPAAVIVETVQGEGGVNVARVEWLRALAALCKERGILLIVDDIQAGCGRTGAFFSFEEAGIVPDFVTLSKSLSGYGLPMSLVLIRRDLDVWKPGQHSGTFRGNNLAFVGGTSALELYWKDSALMADVARKATIVETKLASIAASYPDAGFVARGRGLMRGIANESRPELASAVSAESFKHGLVIETSGANDEVLKFLPALTIPDDELARGLDVVEASFATVLG